MKRILFGLAVLALLFFIGLALRDNPLVDTVCQAAIGTLGGLYIYIFYFIGGVNGVSTHSCI